MSSGDGNATEILERLHLKLVVADADAQLQRFTDNHLVQVIQIASANPETVSLVTEILSFFNRRIKNNEGISFPVRELLKLVGGGTFLTNLSSIYLKTAFGRLSSQEKIELLPSILERLVEKVGNKYACNDIFLLLIPGLIAVSKMARDKWPSLPDLTKVSDRLCRYFTLLMLFENDRGSAQRLQMCAENVDAESTYPGLSQEDCSFMHTKILHSYPSLTEVKDAIVHLLDYDFLPEAAAFPVLVVSSACQLNRLFSNLGFSVSDASSLALKKVDIQKCVDDPKVVETLMSLYLGSAASQEKNIPVQQKIPHCSALIKAKILPYLTRSNVAPTTFMNNVKICLDVEKDIHFSKKTLALLQFIMAVTEKMPPAALNAFANTFFKKMLTVIESGEIENAQCAALAYRCLALLGKSKPELVLTRMDLIENLFTCIADNAEDVSYAIMECLSSWQSAFSDTVDTPVLEKLKDIVKAHIAHDNNRTRLSAIKYADALLRTGDMEIRWLLIRGAGDKRDDVRREGARLLEASFKLPTPSIESIVNYIWREQNKSQVEAGDDYVKMTAEIYEMSTKFIWAACAKKAGDSQQLFFLENDEHFFMTAPMVANLLKTLSQDVVQKIVRMSVQAATFSQDLFLLRIATCFVAVYPIVDMPSCALACSQLARGSSRFEVLETASRLSVMTATPNENAKNLEKYLSDLDSNHLPGTPWLAASALVFADLPDKAGLFERMYKRLLVLINQAYDHPSSMLESVFGALSLLLKNGLHVYTLDQEQAFDLIDVCEKVAVSRKDAITLRARHAAVEAIGLFDSKSSIEVGQKMATALFTVGEGPPQSALQLGVGVALWNTCLGPFSALRREAYLLAEASVQISSLQATDNEWCLSNISHVLNTLLTEKVVSRNHHLRRAAVVWLMIFVQKATISAPSAVKGCITQIQTAFAEALTENDDFTQDIASKGMGIAYQMASPEEKKLLIDDLMSALGEGRTSSVKVQSDTVVFKDNMLGKAPDGSNLTTYKELCSLATDLNQPDLLYKFMQLAKHNAQWNAKKGAAFGFGEILEQASDELQPYFGQLAPKLFRYRYDPDLKVQQSMKSIWSVLTSGKRNVIEEYADPIAKELIPLLTDREWRVRESSCLALADLLHSNDTPYMHSQLPALFETVMRVRDDIKESVRLAAERTADSLRKLIIRLATTSNKAKAEAFLTTFLPIIIAKGVNSTVKATVEFSLVLLMELSKTAGKQLQGFLHILIPCFLDAISDNESAVLNYMAVRSSANQLEQLDDLRSQFAGTSPMMSAINDLLPYIDSSALQTMQPRVCDQLRSSIGVSTRAAAAQFITQLTLRAPQLLMDNKPSCDKLFASLAPGVSDRNPSVRKNSANALSYLAKFVSAGPVDKLMSLMNKNLVSDSEDSKRASLHVLKNFSAHCSDIIQGHGAQILPYIFLETCREVIKGDDVSKKHHEEWNELWEELVPSTSSALVLYRQEVVAVAVDLLHNSQVWTVKAQAGRMLAIVAESLGSLHLLGVDADQILSSLLPLLSGRTWDGKEKILLAVTSIFVASGSQLTAVKGTTGMNEISEILKREAGKKKKDYVAFALSSCAAFAEHTPSTEMAQWLQMKVETLVSKILDSNAEKSDSEDENLSNLEKEALVVKFLSTNLVAFTTSLGAYRNGAEAEEAIKVLASFVLNTNLYWKARQDVLAELYSLVSRWQLTSPVSSDPLVQSLLTVAEEMCDNQRKSVAAQALQIVMKMAERRDCYKMDWDVITTTLQNNRAAKETGLSDRLDSALQMETD